MSRSQHDRVPSGLADDRGDPGQDISWVVTDLDGTIVGRDLRLVERSAAAARAFRATGGEVFVATGRSEESAGPFHRELGLDTPAILYNGARITDLARNEPLLDLTLDRTRRDAVRETIPRLAANIGVVGFCQDVAYILRDAPILPDYARRDAVALRPLDGRPMSELAFSKIMIIGANASDLVTPRLLLADAGITGHLVQSEAGYLEVLPSGASKGDALLWLARERNVDPRRIAAIGDNPNDASMLAAAGLGIAVAEAHPDAKAAADLVIGSCDSGALADLITLLDSRR